MPEDWKSQLGKMLKKDGEKTEPVSPVSIEVGGITISAGDVITLQQPEGAFSLSGSADAQSVFCQLEYKERT
jgi:hypothetical protein